MQTISLHPRPLESDTLGVGPRNPSRGIWCTLKFEKLRLFLKHFCVLYFPQILRIFPLLLICILLCHSASIASHLPYCHSLPTGLPVSICLFTHSFILSFSTYWHHYVFVTCQQTKQRCLSLWSLHSCLWVCGQRGGWTESKQKT